MKLQKSSLSFKTILPPLIGIVAFILYIIIINISSENGLSQIIINFQKINPIYYAIAVASSLLEMFFFTYSWKTLLDNLSLKLSFVRATLYVFYGNFIDTLLPAGSTTSDLTRVYLVTKEYGKTKGGLAVASLVMHRFIGMGMNVLVLAIGAILLLNEAQATKDLYMNLIIIATVVIAVVLIVLIAILTNEKISAKFISSLLNLSSKFGHFKFINLRNNMHESVQNYHESMKQYVKSPKALIFSFLLMVITWFFSLTTQYLVFQSLGVSISLAAIAITAGIALAVSAVPGGIIGIPDATMLTLYTAFTGDPVIATVSTLLIRFLTLWLRFIIGFVAQQWLELKPMKPLETNDFQIPSKA